jgi:hypothetical protein
MTMTDPVPLTDPSTIPATTTDDQRSRVERLQRRCAARMTGDSMPPPRSLPCVDSSVAGAPEPAATRPGQRTRRRRHPASGARIGAAGFGLATMLGLVGAMGLSRTSTTAQTASATGAPSQVVVVIHRTNTMTPAGGESSATPGTTTGTRVSGPITLRTRPTVRAAAPSPSAPSAHTHGSR